ncbi:MAG: hypothetical protein HY320_07825, partial [Armatimonadetes bacterium]|nr:hypothetical protein [Armatimonadota bacterium]
MSAPQATVGAYGKGGFYQKAGTTFTLQNNLYLGTVSNGDAYGKYEVNGANASFSAQSAYVGTYGRGSVEQTNGTVTLSSRLILGHYAGGQGTYYFNPTTTGSTTVKGTTFVGYGGSGKIYQYRNTMTYQGTVRLGNNQGAEGYYKLAGGVLQNDAAYQVVGYQGKGTVEQS